MAQLGAGLQWEALAQMSAKNAQLKGVFSSRELLTLQSGQAN